MTGDDPKRYLLSDASMNVRLVVRTRILLASSLTQYNHLILSIVLWVYYTVHVELFFLVRETTHSNVLQEPTSLSYVFNHDLSLPLPVPGLSSCSLNGKSEERVQPLRDRLVQTNASSGDSIADPILHSAGGHRHAVKGISVKRHGDK